MFSQVSVILSMGVDPLDIHPLGRHPLGRHPQETATAADGIHPTGMHSCYILKTRSTLLTSYRPHVGFSDHFMILKILIDSKYDETNS